MTGRELPLNVDFGVTEVGQTEAEELGFELVTYDLEINVGPEKSTNGKERATTEMPSLSELGKMQISVNASPDGLWINEQKIWPKQWSENTVYSPLFASKNVPASDVSVCEQEKYWTFMVKYTVIFPIHKDFEAG